MVRADKLAKSYPGKEHHRGFDDYIDHPDAIFIAETRALVPELIEAVEALTAQLAEREKQLGAAVEALESVAHSGGNLCEVCGADCCDTGFDDPETFQCGCFRWRGAQEAGEVGG